jgi:hypothetical protein
MTGPYVSSPLPAQRTAPEPARVVHHGDALAWLKEQGRLRSSSIVTSLPDLSELPRMTFGVWCGWFENAVVVAMHSVPDEGVAIFFQSDIRRAGLWVDKGALVARAAERASMRLLFHRIVCRRPAGTLTFGRASYSHLLGFSRVPRPSRGRAVADVLPDAGFMPGQKAMGVRACAEACRFILDETPTRTVVDPFCGWGTVLAVANVLGMDAVGVDLSVRMCHRARSLRFTADEVARP